MPESNYFTYHFREELAKDTDEFVIHQLATLQARVFQTLDLLFDNDFESSRTNEQRRR